MPSIAELASATGYTPLAIHGYLARSGVRSIHAPLSKGHLSDARFTLEHVVPDPSTYAHHPNFDLAEAVASVFGMLPRQQAYLLREHFYGGRDLKNIGKELGFSRERARQLKEDALKKIRLSEFFAGLREFA
jgi:DNA-directed RNA polymerase sigma subunit (sigma70/sigma32)